MITQQDIDDFIADANSDDDCHTCNNTGEGQAPDSACPECSSPRSREYREEP